MRASTTSQRPRFAPDDTNPSTGPSRSTDAGATPGEDVRLAGQRSFREIAFHPDMTDLPGLDPANAGDRILATAPQLAHRELSSTVIVVTRDRNMHKKARRLELPAVDVADL